MFRTIVLFAFLAGTLPSAIADKKFDNMLLASMKLVNNSDDTESLEIVKDSIGEQSSSYVRSSLIKIVSYALLKQKSPDFKSFKKEISEKYPNHDFSSIEGESDYKKGAQDSFKALILNAISTKEKQSGNSPSVIKVNPREIELSNNSDPIEPVDDEGMEPNFQVTTPEDESTQEEDFSEEDEEIAKAEAIPEIDLGEAQKEREGDIAKNSVYYKAYHAAVKAQNGNGEGIKELHKLSFEKKPKELTSSILKVMTLGMVKTKSSSLGKYIKQINETYPNGGYLKFLEEEPFVVNCSKCKGEGHNVVKCPTCVHNGQCRNCKGKGRISYRGLGGKTENKVCPSCKGSKKCATCNGSQKQKKDCRICRTTGKRRDHNIVADEYKKALQYLIDVTPKLATDNGLYIGVGVNKKAMARLEEAKRQKREREQKIADAKRKKEEKKKAREMARLDRIRKEKEREEREKNQEKGETGIIYVEAEGSREANLKHAVLELRNYLDAQKRTGRATIVADSMKDVKGVFENGRPMLIIEVLDSFARNGRDYLDLTCEGIYRFWKLRVQQNGVGGKVILKMTNKGDKVYYRDTDPE